MCFFDDVIAKKLGGFIFECCLIIFTCL